NAEVQSGNLAQYQTIILPSQRASRIMKGYSTKSMPEKYAGGLGEEGARALKKYVKNGGTLIAFDKACGFVTQQFDLPIENAVKGLKKEEFYIPGTLIRANIDVNNTLAWGVQESVAT